MSWSEYFHSVIACTSTCAYVGFNIMDICGLYIVLLLLPCASKDAHIGFNVTLLALKKISNSAGVFYFVRPYFCSYCLEKFSVDDDRIEWICWDCAPEVTKVEQFRKSERISVRKIRAFDVRVERRIKLNNCKLKAKRLDKAKHDANGAVQSASTHNPLQILHKEKPSQIETKKQKDIGEECADVCYSEQQIKSVKAWNAPLISKHPESYCSTLNEEGGMVERSQLRGDSSPQDPKSAQLLIEIGKQQKMRKPRRRFVVLDDDSDFEGEGGAIGGNFSSFSDEHYFPLNNLYSDTQVESVNCLPAEPVIDPIWR